MPLSLECPEPYSSIVQSLSREGIEISAELLQTDLRIPTVVVMLGSIPGLDNHRVAGLGSGSEVVEAFAGALLESCQTAAYWIEQARVGSMTEGAIHHPDLDWNPSFRASRFPMSIEDASHLCSVAGSEIKDVAERVASVVPRVLCADIADDQFGRVVRMIAPPLEDTLAVSPRPGRRALAFREAVRSVVGTEQ